MWTFFQGRTAETTTLLPMLTQYCRNHDVTRVTVVADATMLSGKNLDALDEAGFDYIVADRLRKAPYEVPITDEDITDSPDQTHRGRI